jgi:tRNA-specific 2-thiouridylase
MTAERGVLVALSGGVDSALAAALLCEQGLRVSGASLLLDDGPAAQAAMAAAAAVAAALGIDHEVLDVRRAFEQEVLRPCWEAYRAGRTPNPCTWCNPRLKFARLLAAADAGGARWLATGHHARIGRAGGRAVLLRGRDAAKDQSYFLFALAPEQLERLRLPIGDSTKAAVRAAAAERGLPAAAAPESQDACLAADAGTFPEALRERFGAAAQPGPVVDEHGAEIGRHPGIHRYTVGQRRGLGLALGRRAWVRTIDAAGARIELTHDPRRLAARSLRAAGFRLHPACASERSGRCQVQIRSRHRPAPAHYRLEPDGRARITFDQPQNAITPGQAAVCYRDQTLIGGGWIERVLTD